MYVRLLALVALIGCGGPAPKLPVDKLEDPNTCKECHGAHYTQWSGSMHAYASDDPVFVAMNKRGQRETSNQLGTFCVKCHAPMAVQLGLTDGTNFDPTALPPTARGITCFFCHDVKTITDDHNNGLVLAVDDTMRGGVHDPVDSPAHNSSYDKGMDSYTNKSQMCGSCHDIITPKGVAVERSYSEWQATVFNTSPSAISRITCSGCHMQTDPSTSVIADKPGLNVKSRDGSFHLHTWPAIDQAYAPFPADSPQNAAQVSGIQAILDPALIIIGPTPTSGPPAPGGICLDPPGKLTVRMDTLSTGHMYPSGAAQDRRVWLEVIAYRADNSIVFSSGVVPDNKDPEDIGDPIVDCSMPGPQSCSGFWDRAFKDDGTPAHFFWDIASEQSHLLKPPVTFVFSDPAFDHSTTAAFSIPNYTEVDHITARIRTRPFAYAALDELVASGDLDATIASSIKTLDSQTSARTWTLATKGTGDAMFTNCNP